MTSSWTLQSGLCVYACWWSNTFDPHKNFKCRVVYSFKTHEVPYHDMISGPQTWFNLNGLRSFLDLLSCWNSGFIISYHDSWMSDYSLCLYLLFHVHGHPVNSPRKGQWRGALMFSLICAWINAWVNNRETGDLRRHWADYDVSVMSQWNSSQETVTEHQ